MDDPVVAKVLEMIATNQRTQHAENQKWLERISEDVGEIKIELAVMLRDLGELKAWRRDTVDPFLASARDLTSQAKGASRVVKFFYALGGILGVGVVYKIGAALLATLSRVP